jgi:hypothetical protein
MIAPSTLSRLINARRARAMSPTVITVTGTMDQTIDDTQAR